MVRVLGRASSINVRKVLWLCEELGLEVDHEPWGEGAFSLADPAFRRLNPNGLVPVLVDGDHVLSESHAICRYLAAREARGDLWPEDVKARSVVDQWMDWAETSLNGAWRSAFMGLVRKDPAFADPTAIRRGAEEWRRMMAVLDARLADTGAYVAGASFTLADIVLGLACNRWMLTPIERPELPAVTSYLARLNERPAFRRHGANGLP